MITDLSNFVTVLDKQVSKLVRKSHYYRRASQSNITIATKVEMLAPLRLKGETPSNIYGLNHGIFLFS